MTFNQWFPFTTGFFRHNFDGEKCVERSDPIYPLEWSIQSAVLDLADKNHRIQKLTQ
jgi:hypothetical protein